MAHSPTIFNFLPAEDGIALRELAEGITCPQFGCCRQSLVWWLRFPFPPHASQAACAGLAEALTRPPFLLSALRER